MSVTASPRAIGLFVLGAIVLGVLGLLALGGAKLFNRGDTFTIYFDESLKGLRRGAPLTFRGVDVGQVTEIRAIYDGATGDVRVPVTVELRPGAVVLTDGAAQGRAAMERLIGRGLRPRLDVQSLLTGQLLIALDFFVPAGAAKDPPRPGEIPSVPSTLANLQRTIDQALMGAPEIANSLQGLVASLRELLSTSNRDSLQQALMALAHLADTLGDPEGPTQRALADLPGMMADLRAGAAQAPLLLAKLDQLASSGEKLVATGDARLTALGDNVAKVAASLRRVTDQAAQVLGENRRGLNDFVDNGLPEVQGFVEDATILVNQLSATIRDMRQDPARFFLGDRAGQGVNLR
ncbi:MAG: MlaD family protein [Geminicoccaceae bacterium]